MSSSTSKNTSPADLQTRLAPTLAVLEDERKRALHSVSTTGTVIMVLACAGILLLLVAGGLNSPLLIPLPLVLGVIIFAFVYSSATATYRNGFKAAVLPALVQDCAVRAGGTLEYSSGAGITENEFRSSQLFRAPDRYSSEDLIQGKIGATTLRFSEVHAEDCQRKTDGKGHTRTEYHTIFKGLFLVADFNKHFNGTTFVLPDTMERALGRVGQSLQKLGAQLSFGARELVKLEDPEFERAFVVYSTDQVEARYILSPALMRRLLDFRARCRTEIYLAFSGGNLMIAIPLGTDWLEPPSLSTPLTFASLADCLDQLRFALGIVAELDLNTRIWSK